MGRVFFEHWTPEESAKNPGVVGYKTPNIDRIVKEGRPFFFWFDTTRMHV